MDNNPNTDWTPLGPPTVEVDGKLVVDETALAAEMAEAAENCDNPLWHTTDADLKRQLNEYAKSIREEFETHPATQLQPLTSLTPAKNGIPAGIGGANDGHGGPGSKDSAKAILEHTRQLFRRNLPSACAQIVWLANNSPSDSVRLRASQVILKQALEDATMDQDPLSDILASLQGQLIKK